MCLSGVCYLSAQEVGYESTSQCKVKVCDTDNTAGSYKLLTILNSQEKSTNDYVSCERKKGSR